MSQGTWCLIRKRLTPASGVGDGAAPRSPGVGGGAAQRSPGSGKEPRRGARGSRVGPRSGVSGFGEEPNHGVSGIREEPRRGAPGSRVETHRGVSGVADAAAPRSPEIGEEPRRGAHGPGVEPAAEARTRATQARFTRERAAAAAWAPGLLCVYNLRPGKSAGPSRAGRWRDQKGLCCTGRGGRVCFSGWVWVPSPREG